MLGKIILFFGIIIIVFMGAFILGARNTTKRSVIKTTLSEAKQPRTVAAITQQHIAGLQVSRDFIMSSLEKTIPDISFSQSLPTNGRETYTAQKDQNTIQLIGKKTDLDEISSTASIDTNTNTQRMQNIGDRNQIALTYINRIPNLIDPDAGAWVLSVMQEAGDDMKTGEASIQQSIVLHGRKYTLSVVYTSILKIVTIKIVSSAQLE